MIENARQTIDKKKHIYKYSVNDINHIKVKDKNNPDITYDTNVSFITWMPPEMFDKNDINNYGYSTKLTLNLTAFMTNGNDKKLIQEPFLPHGAWGYIAKEFITDGVFFQDAMDLYGKTPPGERIGDHISDDKKKFVLEEDQIAPDNVYPNKNYQLYTNKLPGHHYEKNVKNIVNKDRPLEKLVEKSMRNYNIYLNNKILYDNFFNWKFNQLWTTQFFHYPMFSLYINYGYNGSFSSSYEQQYGNYLVHRDDNRNIIETNLPHNDINITIKKMIKENNEEKRVHYPTKISNFVVQHDCRMKFQDALEMIKICREKLNKQYIYLYDNQRHLEKISFEEFLVRNFVNSLIDQNIIQNNEKEDVVKNFTSKKQEIYNKISNTLQNNNDLKKEVLNELSQIERIEQQQQHQQKTFAKKLKIEPEDLWHNQKHKKFNDMLKKIIINNTLGISVKEFNNILKEKFDAKNNAEIMNILSTKHKALKQAIDNYKELKYDPYGYMQKLEQEYGQHRIQEFKDRKINDIYKNKTDFLKNIKNIKSKIDTKAPKRLKNTKAIVKANKKNKQI